MMSHPIPPIVPVPGEGGRIYPPPLPAVGTHPPPGTLPDAPEQNVSEEEVIRQQEAERLRQQDLVDLLTADHRTIRELFATLTHPDTEPERRGAIAEVVVAELSRHVVLERRYLVPTVREVLASSEDEAQVVDRMMDELALLEEATRRLHERDPEDPEFDRWCSELSEVFDRRARQQEEHLFPRLRNAGDEEHLRELAKRARAAKDTAPTRPHPKAPDQPPLSRVTDPVIGAADKVRDELTGRPTERRDVD